MTAQRLRIGVTFIGRSALSPWYFLRRTCPGIAAGDSIGVSVDIASGNKLEPLLGWWLLSRTVSFDVTLNKPR